MAKEVNMPYRIAVASNDGKVVNQHFGHSRQFIIFEVSDQGEWDFSEIRSTIPACSFGEHSDSSIDNVVRVLSDCRVVVVSQIGYGAEQALNTAGIKAYTIPDLIYTALNKVIKSLSQQKEIVIKE
jgi:predicted Fe-Mo cluster-binding NifX family protein